MLGSPHEIALEHHEPSTAVRGHVPEKREPIFTIAEEKSWLRLAPILALVIVPPSSSPAGTFSQSMPQSHNSDQPSHSDGFLQPCTVVRNCPARKGRNRGESTRPIL